MIDETSKVLSSKPNLTSAQAVVKDYLDKSNKNYLRGYRKRKIK